VIKVIQYDVISLISAAPAKSQVTLQISPFYGGPGTLSNTMWHWILQMYLSNGM